MKQALVDERHFAIAAALVVRTSRPIKHWNTHCTGTITREDSSKSVVNSYGRRINKVEFSGYSMS